MTQHLGPCPMCDAKEVPRMAECIHEGGDIPLGESASLRWAKGRKEAVVRCADCAHCKQVSDRSGVYCELWRHRTRLDGYCHMGEVE